MAKCIEGLLKLTLLKRMETTDLDEITVTELIQLTGINRKTFYNHYRGLSDLLCQIVSEQCNAAILENANTDSWEIAVKKLMILAKENQDYLRKIFQSDYELAVKQCIRKNMDIAVLGFIRSAVAAYERRTGESVLLQRHQEQYLVQYYSSFLFSLILEWFSNGMKEEIDECITMIDTLTNNGVYEGIRYFAASGANDVSYH